ncbi:nitroreductase family deazaflavin-dependent oxidoreductase [Actinomadura sp. ATCC 31491]|uniref:Nitroreductase family deazaflavin-dependent oxidoreductase n=1 Tax=Actinomadura luzonensis TaxID=2805427 RepID=A0ABT0FU43_9ACTN|nr:nitroreductase/quinone reductase family protein [Actinomadura luzonensis]MCK2215416.1 nitroreductase family deazaflavin-dependent oxidoreductase [Actinomadura luzonensis]
MAAHRTAHRTAHRAAAGREAAMPVEERTTPPRLPPRRIIRLAWSAHRGLYRVFGGHAGLWRPRAGRWGALHLTTTGRRTGRRRGVIIAYLEDGPDLVALAMNGWGPGEPSWWLNLQANPDATVHLRGGRRRVRAHAATGGERARLWARWREIDPHLDAFAALRPTETAVVVLKPSP